jgi:hypothetical protein
MGEIGATYMYMEWKLFDKIPETGSVSYKELAASVGAEESVVCEWPSFPSTTRKPERNHQVGHLLI